jgi:hypothetical protein
MAKINLGALAQDVRGSLAGTTFSKGRSGAIVRQKVSPVQPRTARQLAQRAVFTQSSQGWRDATDDQRAAWNNWAANHKVVDVFGMARILSGIAAYTRVNATRLTAALAQINDPPADETPVANAASAAAVGATGIVTVTFAAAPADGSVFLVFTTQGVSPGVSFVNSQFRLGGVAVGDATLTAFPITPTDLNERLPFNAGQKVGVRVVAIGTNGVVQSSTLFQVIAT